MDLKTSSRVLERVLGIAGKNKNPSEASFSLFSLLYAEIIKQTHDRSTGFEDFENRLRLLGSMVGLRIHQCLIVREKSSRRENLLLNALFYVHNTFYKFAFGKAADSLEKSNQDPSDYMIIDLDPVTTRFISMPKELAHLSCNSFIAGMLQAVLSALQFSCEVTAHTQPTAGHPCRSVFLIHIKESSAGVEVQS